MTEFAIPGLMPITSPVYDTQRPHYNLPDHNYDDSLWQGIGRLGPVRFKDGLSPNAPAEHAYLVFWGPTTSETTPDLVLSSADGRVTIIDAATWVFAVPVGPLALAHGAWNWKFTVVAVGEAVDVIRSGTLAIV